MKPACEHYDFHGVNVAVRAAPEILEALRSRIRRFPRAKSAPVDLRFDFKCRSAERDRLRRPSGAARQIYCLPSGEALYFPEANEIFLSADGVEVLCDLAASKTLISLSESRPDQIWNATHLLFTIPLIEHLKRFGLFNLHSAGFAWNGSGLLFPGNSGCGKSTLSVALLRAEFEFLGDDMQFLKRRDGKISVHAFPEELDLTENTLELFPSLRVKDTPTLRAGARGKYGFEFDQISPRSCVEWECFPKAVIFPQIADCWESRLSPVRSSDAFVELVPHILLCDPALCREHLSVFTGLLQQTRCFRLETGRDFDRLPDLLRSVAEV